MTITNINTGDRWCILRTSGGRTLRLAASLAVAGIEAWTPKRSFKRVKPGKRPKGAPVPTVEIDAPILPTFVFAKAAHLAQLIALAADPASQLPAFSVFTHAGRAPLIRDQSVGGLRQAEDDAAAAIQRLRDAEMAEERRQLRAAAANSERERRRLLRAKLHHFRKGETVSVTEVPAFAGMSGEVVSSDGRSAIVAFGGLLTIEVEAWQLVGDAVQERRS